jgi:hypothetical protein
MISDLYMAYLKEYDTPAGSAVTAIVRKGSNAVSVDMRIV